MNISRLLIFTFQQEYRLLRLWSALLRSISVKEILMRNFIKLTFTTILLFTQHVYAQDSRQLVQDNLPTTARRLALVIGNGTYTNAPPLKNPPNDATDMANTLSSLGFAVEHGVNLTQREMKSMIRAFGQKLKDGSQGLFFYAGHGIQLNGRNYLIPVEADIQSEADVEDQGVDAALMLRLMDEAGNGLNVVILDACRNNPFARSFRSTSNGLAQMDAPRGTLIAYATSPGSIASDGNGRNGLYTQELLRIMRTPNLDIENVFKRVRTSVLGLTQGKQTPWESSSLTGDFYFVRTSNVEPPAIRVVPMSEVRGLNIDEFNGSSLGEAYGITYTTAIDGQGAIFSRENESRVQYPLGVPTEGTLEWWINVKGGYIYYDFKLNQNQPNALIFTTAGGDVWYPGSTWFYTQSDGQLSLQMATTKHEGPKQILTAPNTNFRFNQWHSIGISYGSEGQYIMLDGVLVASAPQNTQKLGRGGTHVSAIDIPTIGELVSGFWKNNRYDAGFEGIVDRFRISPKQKDWVISTRNLGSRVR
jgi:Caspase domain